MAEKKFGDYKAEGHAWITLASGEYYPDILPLGKVKVVTLRMVPERITADWLEA